MEIKMNERIRELAEQAGLELDNDLALEPEPIYYTTQKDLEKLAELIVRECAGVVEKNLFESIGWNTSKKVKQHFGVEE